MAVLSNNISLHSIIQAELHLHSFRYASTCLWNQLHFSLRKPHSDTSSSIFYSPIPSPITSSSSDSPLCTSITPSLSFIPGLKPASFTHSRSFTSSFRTASTDLCLDRFFWATRFLFLFFPYLFRFWAVRWPSCRIVSYRIYAAFLYGIWNPKSLFKSVLTESCATADGPPREALTFLPVVA